MLPKVFREEVQLEKAGFEERVTMVGERKGVSVRGNNGNDPGREREFPHYKPSLQNFPSLDSCLAY